MTPVILVLNVGSSSIKVAAYPASDDGEAPVLRGKIAGIGTAPTFSLAGTGAEAASFGPISADAGQEELTGRLLHWLDAETALGAVIAVGHRVVHGGTAYAAPVRIDARVMETLAALEPLAPLHSPTTSPPSAPSPRAIPTFRRSPVSTRRSIRARTTWPGFSRCRAASPNGVSCATASTASPTSSSRANCPAISAKRPSFSATAPR